MIFKRTEEKLRPGLAFQRSCILVLLYYVKGLAGLGYSSEACQAGKKPWIQPLALNGSGSLRT